MLLKELLKKVDNLNKTSEELGIDRRYKIEMIDGLYEYTAKNGKELMKTINNEYVKNYVESIQEADFVKDENGTFKASFYSHIMVEVEINIIEVA